MPKNKLRKKFYVIVSGKKNLGAFPFSKDGLKKAKDYVVNLKKTSSERFLIKKG